MMWWELYFERRQTLETLWRLFLRGWALLCGVSMDVDVTDVSNEFEGISCILLKG